MPSLFDPITLGDIEAPNRILMAPLTRGRSTGEHVPTEIMIDYYRQRAGAGLIISEGTGISHEGLGWPYAPGIWNAEQVEAWKPITDAVHQAGGRIVTQLWHLGRLARKDVTGNAPFSSSATTAPARPGATENPNVEARAMTLDDIARTLDDYSNAARNALAAGFDGVELHAANGYLIDQFMRDGTNLRDDDYGGPVENRLRLLREVVGRLIDAVGAGRTGVRFSPNGEAQGTNDSNPESVFIPAAQWLSDQNIAFLELRENSADGTFGKSDVPKLSPRIRPVFKGALVLNQDYGFDNGQADLDTGIADAIAFGRPYIANPDLTERFRQRAELNKPNARTFYTKGPEGYIDYPALATAMPA